MLISPFFILGLLLVGAALAYLVAVLKPRYTNFVPPIASGIGLVLYLFVGGQLPQNVALGSGQFNLIIPGWQWLFDDTVWPLVGILLLFLFAWAVFCSGNSSTPGAQITGLNLRLQRAQWQPILLLCLGAAAMTVIGAATTTTLMTSWTLLGIFWALFLLTAVDSSSTLPSLLPRIFWILAPLLFLGIMVGAQPSGSDLSDFSGWPAIAIAATLLATMAQMGVLPFIGWRLRSLSLPVNAGAVLLLTPSLAGAGLFVRFLATGQINASIVLLLTLIALFSIMQGLRRIWMYGQSPFRLPADLALVLTSLAFLVGTWAGVQGAVAAVSLLVFGSAIYFLLEQLPLSRARWWRLLAPLIALLAVAGLPMTAGFVALGSLYDVWWINSRFVFGLVLVILWMLLLTALIIKIRDSRTMPQPPISSQRDNLLMEGGQLALILGLVAKFGRILADIHLLTWLALLLSGAGAFVLSRYVGEVQNIVVTVNSAIKPGQKHLFRAWSSASRVGRQIVSVLGESAYILEGEQGLLWLITFLVVLFLVLAN